MRLRFCGLREEKNLRGERLIMQEVMDKKTEQMVSHMMLDMGVPAHLKGYRYVRAAVLMAEEDMKVVGSVTKLLYPEIAKRYNTTDGKVERAIRNAIEISWERGNKKTFEQLFGYCAESGQGRLQWISQLYAEENRYGIRKYFTDISILMTRIFRRWWRY